jgi:muconolactone delta-isomerase
MKYVLTWWERPGGSHADYEAAQKRVLSVFQKWQIPESLIFHQFLVRVGEFGGYAVVETDDLAELEKATTIFAVFQFRVEPVLDVMDAVAAQAEGIAWRDSVTT